MFGYYREKHSKDKVGNKIFHYIIRYFNNVCIFSKLTKVNLTILKLNMHLSLSMFKWTYFQREGEKGVGGAGGAGGWSRDVVRTLMITEF